jgi:hypothetical protein
MGISGPEKGKFFKTGPKEIKQPFRKNARKSNKEPFSLPHRRKNNEELFARNGIITKSYSRKRITKSPLAWNMGETKSSSAPKEE